MREREERDKIEMREWGERGNREERVSREGK